MTVGVVSPQSISRKALCALLGSIPQVKVVVDVGNPLQHLESLLKTRPAILLFDTFRPAADLETIVRSRKVLPDAKILVLTAQVDEELELRAIKAGAQGCISREADPEILAKALATLNRGEVWVSQRMASRIIGEFVRSREKTDKGSEASELTRREWEILSLVAHGFRNKNIADQLFVCESTIKTHLYSIYKKLEIGSRLEATLYYYQHLKGSEGVSGARPTVIVPQKSAPQVPARSPARGNLAVPGLQGTPDAFPYRV